MAYRFRANINLKETATGIATWCSQQVAQRLTMAFHLNQGKPNEEPSHHEPQNNGRKWIADIFVPDESWAVMDDFFTHLEAIWHHAETVEIDNPEPESGDTPEYEISWMDVHHCYNEINQPCGEILRYKATDLPEEPEEPDNPCDNILEWDANEGYWNMVVGDLRKREVEGVWKVYEVINLGFVHFDPAGPNGHHGWVFKYDCV